MDDEFTTPTGDHEQRLRALEQKSQSWERRMLSVALANMDMTPATISDAFMRLGITMKFASEMEAKKALIEAIFDRHRYFDEVKIEDTILWAAQTKKDQENKQKKLMALLAAVGTALMGGIITYVLQFLHSGAAK